MTSYELTMISPAKPGEPWSATVTIATGFGPGESWTTPPITLKATDKAAAKQEARDAVTALRAVLDGAG